MKVTTHRCDFCGGKESPRLMGQLTVPMTPEEIALRKRTNPEQAREHEARRSTFHMMMMGFGTPDSAPASMTFDICGECARGLVAARFRNLRKELEGV